MLLLLLLIILIVVVVVLYRYVTHGVILPLIVIVLRETVLEFTAKSCAKTVFSTQYGNFDKFHSDKYLRQRQLTLN